MNFSMWEVGRFQNSENDLHDQRRCHDFTYSFGSKENGQFERKGEAWFIATELQNNLTVEVGGSNFHLHKFPLLSRSGRLNRLVFESSDSEKQHLRLELIPGGAEAFDLAVKFCYGQPIEITSSNIAALRCAAEYLEMTEDLDEGNLIAKCEEFLRSTVLSSWRNSIAVLKTCENLSPWAENLQIVRRCSECIAWMARTDNSRNEKSASISSPSTNPRPVWSNDKSAADPQQQIPQDWWFEDISILRIDHFVRVITAIKAKGVTSDLVGAAIMHYASKSLSGILKNEPYISHLDEEGNGFISDLDEEGNGLEDRDNGLHLCVTAKRMDELPSTVERKRDEIINIVESIVSIIPHQKDIISCSFLLGLLRLAIKVKASPGLVYELEKRVGMQLEQATLSDLLIPSFDESETLYDVDVVLRIVEQFLIQQQIHENNQAVRSAAMRVATLVDSYLRQVAQDRYLSLTKFQILAEVLPDSMRVCHDGLYRAIDTYLLVHSTLPEHERKRLCRLMDCQKITHDVYVHAAQNERLPLRFAIQVLLGEQLRIRNSSSQTDSIEEAETSYTNVSENLPHYLQECWSSTKKEINTIQFDLEGMKAKFMRLQTDYDNLQHNFQQFSNKKSVSGWSSGWKKLSKQLKQSPFFHPTNSIQHDAASRSNEPCTSPIAGGRESEKITPKIRRWRYSIS